MKYVIACLMGLSGISFAQAQTPDATNTSSLSCYYRYDGEWKCSNLDEESVRIDSKEKTNSVEQGGVFDPEDEGMKSEAGDLRRERKEKQSGKRKNRYDKPEKESDTGILPNPGLYDTSEVESRGNNE